MFKSPKLYIQIRRNQVTAVNLETGEEVTQFAINPFSTQRVVLAKFDPANETILAAIRGLHLKTTFFAVKVVIQQLEGAEGGLSDIEKRALRDIAEMAGAKKVYIVDSEQKLSNGDALTIIDDDSWR
ncbi:rod shape-determining protein [Foetidibacter luteolus]|uniref:rod shape-determining protein n=1 Tax=Foetidibacter luteolus TaxID=2608880 RepID=UPI00129BC75F|nr:rod shape-determining protein [Foetidibacter luteolus]